VIFFNKLRYKNILSTGNQFTEIDLRSNKATLIIGANGQGKCLDGDTEIDIEMPEEVWVKYQEFLSRPV